MFFPGQVKLYFLIKLKSGYFFQYKWSEIRIRKNYYLKAFTIYFISFLFIRLFDLIVL